MVQSLHSAYDRDNFCFKDTVLLVLTLSFPKFPNNINFKVVYIRKLLFPEAKWAFTVKISSELICTSYLSDADS